MPGRPGDRTFDQQLMGLDWLFANCKGKTVLDAGCAEGMIAIRATEAGAVAVHGVELVPDRVKIATKLRGDLPVTFEVGDMNTWRPQRQYDIVLGLAILHKLRDPGACAVALANAARHALVLRLPPDNAPTIIDRRSGFAPHYIGNLVSACGFKPVSQECSGPYGEWVGVWTR
jgi:SAM-dependent methyltransferase